MHKKIILPETARHIIEIFTKNKYEIYLVGGAVRDLVLNRPIKDLDFTTNATPEEIQKLFPKTIYNNTYGTVMVIVDEKTTVEITPYRKEVNYSDFRHPDNVVWAKTIEEDLGRRDFTINAMAHDGESFIDPFNGQKDCLENIIRAVGDADRRFQEDALRLIRAVRFACNLGFTIENSTTSAIKNNAKLIENISGERIRDELFKILLSPHPKDGILFLKNTGLLTYILPEVEKCFAVPQKSPLRHHVYDVGTHLVMSLDACTSQNPITRLATLLHDTGKADTYLKDEKTEVITFYNHEIYSTKHAENIADRLKLSSAEKRLLVTLVRYHMFTVSEHQTDKAIKRFIRNVGKENIDEAILLRVADRVGSGASITSWRTELFKKRIVEVQHEPFSIKDLKINGNDVMKITGIKPGPKIGEILQKIFDEVEEKITPNDKKILLKRLKEFV